MVRLIEKEKAISKRRKKKGKERKERKKKQKNANVMLWRH